MKMIHETTDYDSFKKLPGQRDVVEKHVDEIVNSIEEYGWICDPIRVTENMEVFDGQHRLAALRRLGLPVEYLVIDGLSTANAVRIINNTQKKWMMRDYTNSFAETGEESYILMKDLVDKYQVPERIVMRAAKKGSTTNNNYNFKNGKFTFEVEDYFAADEKLPLYKQYCTLFAKHGGHQKAKDSVYFFLIERGYDYKMIETAETKYGDPSRRFDSSLMTVEYIENICNYKKLQCNRIYPLEEYKKTHA